MNILHLTKTHIVPNIPPSDTYTVTEDVSIYKLFSMCIEFWKYLKGTRYDCIHIHSQRLETFGMYALIAKILKIPAILTVHDQKRYTYGYIIKRLFARWFFRYVIYTSKYDMRVSDTYHLVKKTQRTLIYQGVDRDYPEDVLKKESARSHIYKQIGISFTKNIRMVGLIVEGDVNSGVEHAIDMAYLADLYKNLTNTIFIIISSQKVSKNVHTQIHDHGIEGICFVLEDVEQPIQYMKAFDIYVSPRTDVGDLYTLMYAVYNQVSVVATHVGDTVEIEKHMSVSLVPPESAKYLTEALVYVIQKDKESSLRIKNKHHVFPKKFSCEVERKMIEEVYERVG